MSTIANNYKQQSADYSRTFVSTKPASITLIQKYNAFIESLKFSHFGVMTMAILIGTCLGSITAMYVFMAGAPIWVFAIGLFSCVANLVTCISQLPTKYVVNVFALTFIINTIITVIYA